MKSVFPDKFVASHQTQSNMSDMLDWSQGRGTLNIPLPHRETLVSIQTSGIGLVSVGVWVGQTRTERES